ncbi:MAG: hypothetical protein QNJ64_06965 [Crocosphaera sp.]|nr:hypothetical protein [Crocosphaera sp.]
MLFEQLLEEAKEASGSISPKKKALRKQRQKMAKASRKRNRKKRK